MAHSQQFVNLVRLTSYYFSRFDHARKKMTPAYRKLMEETNEFATQHYDAGLAEWIVRQYGWESSDQLDALVRKIAWEDRILRTGFSLIAKYGREVVYEQAHRYVFNPSYRLPGDRPYGTSPGKGYTQGTSTDLPDPRPPDNPDTPNWNEEFGTWTNPPATIYASSAPSAWTAGGYAAYVSNINYYASGDAYFQSISGNPLVDYLPALQTPADRARAAAQKYCMDAFDNQMNIAQGTAWRDMFVLSVAYLTTSLGFQKDNRLQSLMLTGGTVGIIYL